jgi:hypothetical protein
MALGVVGPSSMAEQSQKTVHKIIDAKDPNGWDNQLRDEFGLLLTLEDTHRVLRKRPGGLDCDFIFHFGGAAGNVAVYGATGFIMRLGVHIPHDYGISLIRPGRAATVPAARTEAGRYKNGKLGLFGFAGAEGRGIVHNIFLDGNTFKDSHSVDKKPFVADLKLGMSLIWKNFQFTYTHVYRTREFEGQDDPQIFGSLTLSTHF